MFMKMKDFLEMDKKYHLWITDLNGIELKYVQLHHLFLWKYQRTPALSPSICSFDSSSKPQQLYENLCISLTAI